MLIWLKPPKPSNNNFSRYLYIAFFFELFQSLEREDSKMYFCYNFCEKVISEANLWSMMMKKPWKVHLSIFIYYCVMYNILCDVTSASSFMNEVWSSFWRLLNICVVGISKPRVLKPLQNRLQCSICTYYNTLICIGDWYSTYFLLFLNLLSMLRDKMYKLYHNNMNRTISIYSM